MCQSPLIIVLGAYAKPCCPPLPILLAQISSSLREEILQVLHKGKMVLFFPGISVCSDGSRFLQVIGMVLHLCFIYLQMLVLICILGTLNCSCHEFVFCMPYSCAMFIFLENFLSCGSHGYQRCKYTCGFEVLCFLSEIFISQVNVLRQINNKIQKPIFNFFFSPKIISSTIAWTFSKSEIHRSIEEDNNLNVNEVTLVQLLE